MAKIAFFLFQGLFFSSQPDLSVSILVAPMSREYHIQDDSDSERASSITTCTAWKVHWFAKEMWEEDYVPNQVLRDVRVSQWEHSFVTQQMLEKVRQHPHGNLLEFKNFSSPLDDCTVAVLRFRGHASACRDANHLEDRFQVEGKRHAYIVVGEENTGCSQCPSFYSRAPMVFRQYFSDDCQEFYTGGNMMPIPLGIKDPAQSSRLDKEKPASERRYIWSFVSESPNKYRDSIVAHFKAHVFQNQTNDNVFVKYPQPYTPDYSKLLCESKFVLSPKGHHEDCWRLAESMHCGAIPVVTDGGMYFSKYMPTNLTDLFITFGDASEIGVNEWKHGFATIDGLLKNTKALDKRQKLLKQMFEAYQESWKTEVAKRLAKIRKRWH